MKLISHRGNTNGVDFMNENSLSYLEEALKKGFDVETDMWYYKGNFYLGHDYPGEKIPHSFLKKYKNKLWCHAKEIKALPELIKLGMNTFFHNQDKATLTSKGIIWTYPKEEVTEISVIVNNNPIPRKYPINIYGVCSDYVEKWREYGE